MERKEKSNFLILIEELEKLFLYTLTTDDAKSKIESLLYSDNQDIYFDILFKIRSFLLINQIDNLYLKRLMMSGFELIESDELRNLLNVDEEITPLTALLFILRINSNHITKELTKEGQ